MEGKKVHKEIGSHSASIISLQLNFVTDTKAEVVTLDENGIIKVHKPDGVLSQIDLSKYVWIFDKDLIIE